MNPHYRLIRLLRVLLYLMHATRKICLLGRCKLRAPVLAQTFELANTSLMPPDIEHFKLPTNATCVTSPSFIAQLSTSSFNLPETKAGTLFIQDRELSDKTNPHTRFRLSSALLYLKFSSADSCCSGIANWRHQIWSRHSKLLT
jgi:hypothetical protein